MRQHRGESNSGASKFQRSQINQYFSRGWRALATDRRPRIVPRPATAHLTASRDDLVPARASPICELCRPIRHPIEGERLVKSDRTELWYGHGGRRGAPCPQRLSCAFKRRRSSDGTCGGARRFRRELRATARRQAPLIVGLYARAATHSPRNEVAAALPEQVPLQDSPLRGGRVQRRMASAPPEDNLTSGSIMGHC